MLVGTVVAIAAVAVGACEKRAPSAPAGSATPQAAKAPASAPATTRVATRPPATMNVNGTPFSFPPARLRLDEEDGHVIALLYSDDPREALKDSYTGNSFYLRMELDISDAADLDRAQWHFTAPSAAHQEDSPYGVFLTGRKVQLQPFDVQARFKKDGLVKIALAGKFEVIDSARGEGPVKMLPIAAELSAKVDGATTVP